MVGDMHRGGVNHRDCYLCHFLLDTARPIDAKNIKLSVIDLHRAQLRAHLPLRWRDKDLSALYYSALDIGLTRRDKLRFLKGYFRQPLRQILAEQSASGVGGSATQLIVRSSRLTVGASSSVMMNMGWPSPRRPTSTACRSTLRM